MKRSTVIESIGIAGLRGVEETLIPLGRTTAVIGAAGSGKTSVVEAVALLCGATRDGTIAELLLGAVRDAERTGCPGIENPDGAANANGRFRIAGRGHAGAARTRWMLEIEIDAPQRALAGETLWWNDAIVYSTNGIEGFTEQTPGTFQTLQFGENRAQRAQVTRERSIFAQLHASGLDGAATLRETLAPRAAMLHGAAAPTPAELVRSINERTRAGDFDNLHSWVEDMTGEEWLTIKTKGLAGETPELRIGQAGRETRRASRQHAHAAALAATWLLGEDGVVCVDDADGGMHPSAMRSLATMLDTDRGNTTVFSTSSPQLLEWLDAEKRDAVLVCTRDENGRGRVDVGHTLPNWPGGTANSGSWIWDHGWLEAAASRKRDLERLA